MSNPERVKYLATVRKNIPTIKDVRDETIIFQFKRFFERLEQEIKNKKAENLDSIELIKMFLNEERKLYKEIEIIIYCICASAVKLSVIESVIESLTSKFEIHFNKFRNVKEETPYNKMMISVNRPLPSRCDQVVMTAIKMHFRGQNGIHFVKKFVETHSF